MSSMRILPSVVIAYSRSRSRRSTRPWYAAGLHLKRIGRSARNTPDSIASTLPPMYVSLSSRWPCDREGGGEGAQAIGVSLGHARLDRRCASRPLAGGPVVLGQGGGRGLGMWQCVGGVGGGCSWAERRGKHGRSGRVAVVVLTCGEGVEGTRKKGNVRSRVGGGSAA
eukprot:55374-Chlamydomonas_euryale.AAC.1